MRAVDRRRDLERSSRTLPDKMGYRGGRRPMLAEFQPSQRKALPLYFKLVFQNGRLHSSAGLCDAKEDANTHDRKAHRCRYYDKTNRRPERTSVRTGHEPAIAVEEMPPAPHLVEMPHPYSGRRYLIYNTFRNTRKTLESKGTRKSLNSLQRPKGCQRPTDTRRKLINGMSNYKAIAATEPTWNVIMSSLFEI